ncbi:MAG: T9SS type A sorting domain-containing protein [Flavobacteriales bacterium]|nr:T9SS type A sorting domain-containing protein [Flavobacteriales bacterium]
MKKLVTTALGLLLISGLVAQEVTYPTSLTKQDRVESIVKSANKPTSFLNKGVAFYTETFSNGFDGENGAITVEDSGGDTPIWMMATSASPAGEFSGNQLALTSTTASNGWAIFDCDLWNTPISDGFEDVQGFMTLPELDCSARNTVLVEFEQTFRYCCFSPSPLTLGVSIDGGTTWTEFAAQGEEFIESANEWSGPVTTTLIDISCAAANEASVLVRFGYNADFAGGYSHYFWGIDDIAISENPNQYDLRINQLTNGDVFNIYEYRVTPIQQAIIEAEGGLIIGTMYENTGQDDQTNVIITSEVLDSDDNVVATVVSDPFDLPAKRNSLVCPVFEDTIYQATNWVPSETGTYTVRSTISSDQVQSFPEDDVMEKVIEYTTCMYGHDDETALDLEWEAREADDPEFFENVGYGNNYTVPNEGSVGIGALVRLGPNCDSEFEAEIRTYEYDPATQSVNDAVFLSTFYEIQPEDIPGSIEESFNIYVEFDDEVLLEPGMFYFIALVNDEISPNNLTVLANERTDTDFSSGRINQTGAGDFVWFLTEPETPAIRLIVDEPDCFTTGPSGILEFEELAVELGQNVPNPASGLTTIQYSLDESMDLVFQLTDSQGRLISEQVLGTVAPGQHFIEVDMTGAAVGMYQYSLISGNKKITKRMVVAN